MAWYAYCVSEKQSFSELARHRKPVPLESVTGIGGSQVFLYPASDLAIVVSEYSASEALTQRSGMDHARVISECFQKSTVLPFRFGTVFQDDESLRKSIRSNQRQFACNLERLQGKTEMHLKVVVEDCCRDLGVTPCSETVGRAYLSNLRETASRQRERQTRARAVSFQLHRMFAPLDEEVTCRVLENGKMLLDIAHLIDRKCVERYQNKYASTVPMMKECQLQLSGPWPPYHFVHRLTRSAHTGSTTAAASSSPSSARNLESALVSA